MDPPDNATNDLNKDRPKYELASLPIRSAVDYWKTISRLDGAPNPSARSKIVHETGVSKLPLCAASETFIHPTFFPLDPFHLFYENCMTFFWDTWTNSPPEDPIHIPHALLVDFGKQIEAADSTLPPALSGSIRNTQAKRNSQYKVFEWMAVLHWYLLVIGTELGFDSIVLANFADFVGIVEFAMTPIPRSQTDLDSLLKRVVSFLNNYERLYVQGRPINISRMRLCVFQLIHVPRHIQWNGSVRVGSQATVERKIGEMSHRIRSKKAPFANLANQIYHRELIRILLLWFPQLRAQTTLDRRERRTDSDEPGTEQEQRPKMNPCMQKHSWTGAAKRHWIISRWGKLRLSNKRVLMNQLSEASSIRSGRFYRWFEVSKFTQAENPCIVDVAERQKTPNLIFGEAAAFYEIRLAGSTHFYVVYHPLIERDEIFNLYPRGHWDSALHALNVVWLRDIVGTWKLKGSLGSPRTYILRKHPGLALLTPEELGLPEKTDGAEGLDSRKGADRAEDDVLDSSDESSELEEPLSEGSSDEGLYYDDM
ncbi:hypothetical protein BKA70DRAFT_1096293 [Coprinopsis sp. MPI-PUGE-AT-0042]|nr:hypothetical protein BKA70DRAFT_1096293 [Coprinopsis sp. MPI-PUGE-AT-0042]